MGNDDARRRINRLRVRSTYDRIQGRVLLDRVTDSAKASYEEVKKAEGLFKIIDQGENLLTAMEIGSCAIDLEAAEAALKNCHAALEDLGSFAKPFDEHPQEEDTQAE